jgi:hypothetical protein
MNDHAIRNFLTRFIWLVPPADGIVMDFIRQAALGECPILVISGLPGTGKSRLTQCLEAIVDDLNVVMVISIKPVSGESLDRAIPCDCPNLILTRNTGQGADLKWYSPVIFLPRIQRAALDEVGIDLDAGPEDIQRAAKVLKGVAGTNLQ